MKRVFFILVILLAASLFLLNRLAGNFLASQIEEQLIFISQIDNDMQYQHEGLTVNPALGTININTLSYQLRDVYIESKKIRFSFTYADMIRWIRHHEAPPLSKIRSLRFFAESLEVRHRMPAGNVAAASISTQLASYADDVSGTDSKLKYRGLSIESLDLIYNGRLDDLAEQIYKDEPPNLNHRIHLILKNLQLSNDDIASWLPDYQNFSLPNQFDEMNLHIRYRANEKEAHLINLNLLSSQTFFQANGSVLWENDLPLSQPILSAMDYQWNISGTAAPPLHLPGIGGTVTFDTLSIISDVYNEKKIRNQNLLTLPGKTSVYLGDIEWYPSEELIQQYGLFSQMLGIPHDELKVEKIEASWQISSDTLQVDKVLLDTAPFGLKIQATVVEKAYETPQIVSGYITFTRTSEEVHDFINSFEQLFGLEMPRKNGQVYISFSGDLSSPDFDLGWEREETLP